MYSSAAQVSQAGYRYLGNKSPVHVVRLKSAYHKYIGHFIIKWIKFPYNKPRLLVSLVYLSATQDSRAESLMNEDIPQLDQDIVKTE